MTFQIEFFGGPLDGELVQLVEEKAPMYITAPYQMGAKGHFEYCLEEKPQTPETEYYRGFAKKEDLHAFWYVHGSLLSFFHRKR